MLLKIVADSRHASVNSSPGHVVSLVIKTLPSEVGVLREPWAASGQPERWQTPELRHHSYRSLYAELPYLVSPSVFSGAPCRAQISEGASTGT